MEQEQEGRLGRAAVAAAALALLAGACDRAADPPPAAVDERETLRAELERSRARVVELESELREATASRLAREEEWLRQSTALARMAPAAVEADPEIRPKTAAQASDAPTLAEQRDHEIGVALRSLFLLDQVTGFEVLETGALGSGSTGPVVLRALDDRGRPVATLAAERMRLEGSRSARTVTLVLEEGYERRAGEKLAFDGGTRRIELPEIDPAPWIESLPELFREEDKAPADDDGSWDLGSVRAALNLLLREDLSAGWWRLASLGGVRDGVLRDVQLDGLDEQGRMERKLFADRMEIAAGERGIRIELTEGAQLRGEEKTPFLEGRYRIFLPRASVEAWTQAGIPGLSQPQRAR